VPAQWYLRIGDIECGAADWFAIAIDIDRRSALLTRMVIGQSCSAPASIGIRRARGLEHVGREILRSEQDSGIGGKVRPGLLSSPMTTVQPREVIEKAALKNR